MSQENVEAFKRAWAAGDRRDIDAFLEEVDPDVEWHGALQLLGGDAVYRGHEGVCAALREIFEVLGDTHFEFPEIRDTGDQVVAIGHFRGRGEGSGIDAETPFAYVVDFRNGKATRVHAYLDRAEALEAAGLSD